jgi:xanthine/uracil permease
MAVYIALALEAIGDITASSEVSRLSVDGPEFDSRIQGQSSLCRDIESDGLRYSCLIGGVLADGFAGLL